MPIENDLTAEERAEFAQHGVSFDDPPAVVEEEVPAEETPEAMPTAVPVTEESAPEPDPAAEVAPVVEAPAAPDNRMVPHAALHQERLKTAELARQNQLLMTRTNAILAQARPEVQPLPDMNTDPEGFLTQLAERVQANEQQQAAASHDTRLREAIVADETNFTLYTPDYPKASEHFVTSRYQELTHFYTQEQAQKILQDEVRQIANKSWQQGRPLAEAIYTLAKARGYTSATAAPAPAPAPAPAVTPKAIVDSVKQGSALSRTLGGSASGGASAQLNAEALLNMSDEEFAEHFKLGEKGANARFAAVGGR